MNASDRTFTNVSVMKSGSGTYDFLWEDIPEGPTFPLQFYYRIPPIQNGDIGATVSYMPELTFDRIATLNESGPMTLFTYRGGGAHIVITPNGVVYWNTASMVDNPPDGVIPFSPRFLPQPDRAYVFTTSQEPNANLMNIQIFERRDSHDTLLAEALDIPTHNTDQGGGGFDSGFDFLIGRHSKTIYLAHSKTLIAPPEGVRLLNFA